MTEVWVKVAGHERYLVSSFGRVRMNKANARVLKGSLDRYGYRRVCLDGKTVKVHVLVARAFHGPRPDGLDCAHLNGNCSDNSASNLRWVTRSENNSHQYAHGRKVSTNLQPRGPQIAPEKRSAIIEDIQAGIGGRRIARKYAVSRSTAHAIKCEAETPTTSPIESEIERLGGRVS